jgi:hypothetical protein
MHDDSGDAMSDASTEHDAHGYEIRVDGHLETRWAAWFDALSLTRESDGSTVIQVPVVDQAALHGLLRKLRDVGLPLISVTQIERHGRDAPRPSSAGWQPKGH